jgi:hypothetical protein
MCISIYNQSRKTTIFGKQFDKLKNYEDIAGSATSRKGKSSLNQFSVYLLIHVQESRLPTFQHYHNEGKIVTNTK